MDEPGDSDGSGGFGDFGRGFNDPALTPEARRYLVGKTVAALERYRILLRSVAAGRRPLGETPDNIVTELFQHLAVLLLKGNHSFVPVLLDKKGPLPYLIACVKHACDDISRKQLRFEEFLEWLAKGAKPFPDRNKPEPGAWEKQFEKETFICAAVYRLRADLSRVMQLVLGWNEYYVVLHGAPPRFWGDDEKMAEFLKMPVQEFRNTRAAAVAALSRTALLFEAAGTDDAGQALRDLTNGRPPREGFTSPFAFNLPLARYALQMVEWAAALGQANFRDLLRAVEQCDFISDPENAHNLLRRIEACPEFKSLSPKDRAGLLTTTAILFDHMAAEAERRGDFKAADKLVRKGSAILDEIIHDNADRPPAEKIPLDQYSRIQLQRGILLRNLHEILHHGSPFAPSDELRRARELFEEVLNLAELAKRDDHAISANHQIGVCDLLAGLGDEAETRFKKCFEGWERLFEKSPENGVEFEFRKAYELRRLGDVEGLRMRNATDAAKLQHREAASAYYAEAEDVSHRLGNMRYVEEVREALRKLDEL